GEFDNVKSDVEDVSGGRGADRITGSGANNRLEGGPSYANDDTLIGLAGNDYLYGSIVDPGTGDDTGYADEILYTSRTEDLTFTVAYGTRFMGGAAGENDAIDANVLRLGSGDDNVTTSARSITSVYGGGGNDTLWG